MEPFLAIDELDEGYETCFGGLKRISSKRITVGLTWEGDGCIRTLSTGFTLYNTKLLPILFARSE